MVDVSVKEMMEAGAHFGHQTHRWDPRMKPFIYGVRNGIHIINLQKTLPLCEAACKFITHIVAQGRDVLFVGTKRQAQSIVSDEARRAKMPYVTYRWLGGTLTNFRTVHASIDRLKDLEKKTAENGLEGLTKKEKLGVEKDIIKLTKALGGIKDMTGLPGVIFIVDPHREVIALQEANRLEIPVVAVADTNCNPAGVTHLIPGNDDAIKSIRLFAAKIADACLEGLALREAALRDRGSSQRDREESRSREVSGGKGKAFVSEPESYEDKAAGEYKGSQENSTSTK